METQAAGRANHPVDMENSGRGARGVQGLDRRPEEETLAMYFARLPLRELAGCWVACVVDELIGVKHFGNAMDLAGINRGLVVAAERLHGVTFERKIMATGGAIGVNVGKATPLADGGVPLIQISTEPAPEPKVGTVKNKDVLALFERLSKAPAGAWLIVPEALAKYRTVACSLNGLRRKKVALANGLTVYRDAVGRCVVKRG